MIVMKFGGTSIADAESVERVTEIIRHFLKKKPIVVNSAMGKTTRNLLDTAALSASGRINQAEKKLGAIQCYHLDLAEKLLSGRHHETVQNKLDSYFLELKKLLGGLTVLKELTPRAQDKFLSYGELISTAIVSESLNAKTVNSTLMDARKFIITDENFTGASPIRDLTEKKIIQAMQPVIKSGSVPVVQGFIGSTRKGATTTLGFEGSDLTACLLGSAVQAKDIQIWKDVSGIMTADPEMVPDAKTVKSISFEEVGELTYFGAKVFYSRAVEPARRSNIPVHIYNSKAPDKQGTEVVLKPGPCNNPIKSITNKAGLFLIHIQSNRNKGKSEFITDLYRLMERWSIDPKILHISDDKAVLVCENTNAVESFLVRLNQLGQITVQKNKATVSLVGEGIRNQQDTVHIIFKILGSQSIDLVSNGISPASFTLVINEKDLKRVITKLHGYFFKTLDTAVFE